MDENSHKTHIIYEFGRFVLDPAERTLYVNGEIVHLADKVFSTLLLLVENNGRLMTKEEMMTSIWNEPFVEEGNLAKNISRLRKILNTGGEKLIETLPKRGYRLTANVTELDGDTNLIVNRTIRMRITETVESEDRQAVSEPHPTVISAAPQMLPAVKRPSYTKVLLLGVVGLSALAAFWFGSRGWNRSAGVQPPPVQPRRLTTDGREDNHPSWTSDGQIRFLTTGKDKRPHSMVIDASGENLSEVKDFGNLEYGFWSADGTRVIFVKPSDRNTFYLANADGSGEVALPFILGNFDWSSDGKNIVYQKNMSPGVANLFIYSLETGRSENISNNNGFDADPNFSPDGSQIVFVTTRDGNAEIYIMRSDGSNVRRLTDHPAWDNHPVISPDGSTIAFNADRRNESSEVYLMDIDGSNVRQLTDGRANEYVEPGCWSRDGTQIAFSAYLDGNDDIFVMAAEPVAPALILADATRDLRYPSYSADGKEIVFQAETTEKTGELCLFDPATKEWRVLLKTANPDLAPAFAPDGRTIAFQDRIDNNTELCVINTDGTGFADLTNDAARDLNPAYSPDGRQIAFVSNRGGNYSLFQLYVMNVDGSAVHQLYGEAMSACPSWSHDGSSIIFANDKADDRTGNFELFAIRTDGAVPDRLTYRRRSDAFASYSPDGTKIVFASNTDGNSEIYLMNADGSMTRRLTRNPADDILPAWGPDGTRIIFSSDRGGKFAIYEISLADN